MGIELTDDEIVILHDVFDGYGCDCPGGDIDAIQALAERLGIWKPEEPPTEEELKSREEFRNSPFGRQIAEMFSRANEHMAAMLLDYKADVLFTSGTQWPDSIDWPDSKKGTTLRIRFPINRIVDDEK